MSRGNRKRKRTRQQTRERNELQALRDRYAHAREDAQLAGIIPTTPGEALKSEQVDCRAQAAPPMPEMVVQALRNGWATEDAKKPGLVDELVDLMSDPEVSPKVKIAAFNALRMADESQWKRDHPEDGNSASPGPTVLNVVEVVVSVGGADSQDIPEAAAIPQE